MTREQDVITATELCRSLYRLRQYFIKTGSFTTVFVPQIGQACSALP